MESVTFCNAALSLIAMSWFHHRRWARQLFQIVVNKAILIVEWWGSLYVRSKCNCPDISRGCFEQGLSRESRCLWWSCQIHHPKIMSINRIHQTKYVVVCNLWKVRKQLGLGTRPTCVAPPHGYSSSYEVNPLAQGPHPPYRMKPFFGDLENEPSVNVYAFPNLKSLWHCSVYIDRGSIVLDKV